MNTPHWVEKIAARRFRPRKTKHECARGYAVITAEGYFVGIWRDREIAAKIVNRSPMAQGERIVEMVER